MTWRAYLALTMTGEVGTILDTASGSLTVELNGVEDLTVVCSRASLDGVHPMWWSPWSGALVVTYESAVVPETVMGAGPLTAPVKEDRRAGTVTLAAQGIGALLAKREVLDRDYRPGDEDTLRASTLAWSGVDLGSIVGRIITVALAKRAGWAPIVIPPERPADRQRTYEGWNLSNNGAWKRIQEITEVIGGPDVMLRPRWTDDTHTRIEWVLVTGTEAQPTIAQDRTIVWDATSQDSPVASMSVASDSSALAHRAYCTGAGEGAGVALAMAEVDRIPERMPLLETVVSDSDAEHAPLLAEKARSALAVEPVEQVSLVVHSQQDAPFGTWQVGDLVEVVCEGWLSIPDGSHHLRIISAKYTLGSDLAAIECQRESLGRELEW